jgi:hypothetical protein
MDSVSNLARSTEGEPDGRVPLKTHRQSDAVGASSVPGHLCAAADWKSIDCEIPHDGPPATELGRLEAAWRACSGNAVGAAQIARPARKRCLSAQDEARPSGR